MNYSVLRLLTEAIIYNIGLLKVDQCLNLLLIKNVFTPFRQKNH